MRWAEAWLCADPRGRGDDASAGEQWPTHVGGGRGVVLYMVEERQAAIIVLRVSWAKWGRIARHPWDG